MDAVGEFGGLRLEEERPIDDVYSGYTYFRDGDVVVAKITPCFENGKGALASGLTNGVGFGTTELHVLRAAGTLDAHFLFYCTLANDFRCLGEAEMLGAGGQKRVPEQFFKDWRQPLPPLETQQRIARFLDRKTAQIDKLIARKRALLDRLAELRKALITHAVTKGLNANTPLKPSGIDWLGDIPAHWKVKRLRFLVKLASGATPTTGMTEYWNGGVNWISPKDMKADEITDTIDKVTDLAVEDYGLKRFETENVVIVIRGMILARYVPVSIAVGAYTINQDMKVMASKGEITPWYLQMYLAAIQSYLMTLIAEAAHGTKALRTDALMDAPILVPPDDEQAKIVGVIQNRKAYIDKVAGKVSAFLDSLTEYRSALVTSAVTGQIAGLQ